MKSIRKGKKRHLVSSKLLKYTLCLKMKGGECDEESRSYKIAVPSLHLHLIPIL